MTTKHPEHREFVGFSGPAQTPIRVRHDGQEKQASNSWDMHDQARQPQSDAMVTSRAGVRDRR